MSNNVGLLAASECPHVSLALDALLHLASAFVQLTWPGRASIASRKAVIICKLKEQQGCACLCAARGGGLTAGVVVPCLLKLSLCSRPPICLLAHQDLPAADPGW